MAGAPPDPQWVDVDGDEDVDVSPAFAWMLMRTWAMRRSEGGSDPLRHRRVDSL